MKSIYLSSHYSSSYFIFIFLSSILHYYLGIQAPIVLYVTFLCVDPKWCHKAYWGRVRGTKNYNCHSPGPLEHILCRHVMLLLFPIISYIFNIFFPIFHSIESRKAFNTTLCTPHSLYEDITISITTPLPSPPLQTILNCIAFGMDILSAVRAPRIHSQLLPHIVHIENNTLINGTAQNQVLAST